MLCINPICRFANRFVKQKMPRLGHWVAENTILLCVVALPVAETFQFKKHQASIVARSCLDER